MYPCYNDIWKLVKWIWRSSTLSSFVKSASETLVLNEIILASEIGDIARHLHAELVWMDGGTGSECLAKRENI